MDTQEQQENPQASQAESTVTTGLLGLFMGAVFGAQVGLAWDVMDLASEVYSDRTNGPKYEMGVQQSLAPSFGQAQFPRAPDMMDPALFHRYLKPAHALSKRKPGWA